jgi:hypothetical protein
MITIIINITGSNMKKSSISLAMLLAFSLTACVDDGDDGTQGVNGTDGVSGTDGTDGVSGVVAWWRSTK